MARVEIPAPGDLIMDDAGNVRSNVTVSLTLAGTLTDVTHYSALTGGTSTTGGLKSGSDGTIVDGSGNRRYIDSGQALDLTIDGRSRQLDPLSATVESRSVYHAKADGGALGDGTTDDTAAINNLIASCSLLPGLTRIDFGARTNETYITDGILHKPNVWLNLDTATIKKRANGASSATNCLLQALEVPTATTRVITGTTHTTTTVDGVSTADLTALVVGRTVSGTGIPVGATIATINFTAGSFTLSAAATGSATVSLTIGFNTYYGTYENMKVTGGFLDPNGKTLGRAIVRLLYTDGLTLENVKIVNYMSGTGNFAFCLGGRNGQASGLRIEGGTAVFQDGIHIYHGQNWTVSGCDVACGDDALVCGGEPTDPILPLDPDPIRNVTFTNNTVTSAKGNAIAAYVQSGALGPNWEVTDVAWSGVSGTSGTLRNGGFKFLDLNAGAAGTSQIKRMKVSDVNLDVGSTTHDQTNPYGMWIQSISDLKIRDVTMRLTMATGATTGFALALVRDSENLRMEGVNCPLLQKYFGLDIQRVNGFKFTGQLTHDVATTANNPVRFVDVTGLDMGGEILNVKTAFSGIQISTGTTTAGKINARVTHAAGAAAGAAVLLTTAAHTALDLTGLDASAAFSAVDKTQLVAADIVPGSPGVTAVDTRRRLIFSGRHRFDASVGITLALTESGAFSVGGSAGAAAVFYFDPAEIVYGLQAAKLRVRNIIVTNATAPAANFTVGMYPVTGSAGGGAASSGVTVGAVIAASQATVTAPALTTTTVVDSGEFTAPVAGLYVLQAVVSTAMAASSAVTVRGTLEGRGV